MVDPLPVVYADEKNTLCIHLVPRHSLLTCTYVKEEGLGMWLCMVYNFMDHIAAHHRKRSADLPEDKHRPNAGAALPQNKGHF